MPKSQKKKPGTFLRWLLIIAGLLFLGAGILWQSGLLTTHDDPAPVTQVKEAETKPQADEKALDKTAHQTVVPAEAPSTEPLPVEDIVSSPPATQEAPESEKAYTYQQKTYPFSIYLGSFNDLERAKEAVRQYEQIGLFPYWVKINLEEKGIWYRVYAGYFRDHDRAQGFITENGIKDANIKETAYANLIGTYRSSDELEAMIQAIKDMGYSPYVIEAEGNNISILFVGAFITKIGAEEQERELQSDGILSQVVER
jgi:cell division septation protein DedD